MSDTLFPKHPALDRFLPNFLTMEDPSRAYDVAHEYLPAAEHMNRPRRQYLAVAYLAHTGRLVGDDNRVYFDVTDPEARAYLTSVGVEGVTTGNVAEVREELMGKVEEGEPAIFSELPFIRYNRRRTCRETGEERNAYRTRPRILEPVDAE